MITSSAKMDFYVKSIWKMKMGKKSVENLSRAMEKQCCRIEKVNTSRATAKKRWIMVGNLTLSGPGKCFENIPREILILVQPHIEIHQERILRRIEGKSIFLRD